MAVEPEVGELLLDTPAAEGDPPERQEEQEQGAPKPGDEGDEELEVTIGDEAAPASGERDTNLVKHLREEIRRQDEVMAEPGRNQVQQQPIEVGPKPTIAGCEYDEDRFTAEFEAW